MRRLGIEWIGRWGGGGEEFREMVGVRDRRRRRRTIINHTHTSINTIIIIIIINNTLGFTFNGCVLCTHTQSFTHTHTHTHNV